MGQTSDNIDAVRAFIVRQRRWLSWRLHPHRSVPVGRFDVSTNKWIDVEDAADPERDDLTLATYNIWFSDYCAQARYRAIAKLLSAHTPDVIVFQEVTPDALDEFLAQPWIRQHYYRAAVTGQDVGDCGLAMLSRPPISHVTYTHLPATVGRGFLQANLMVNGRPLTICAVHLQSGKAASRLRTRQVHRVFRAVKTPEDVVLLGDFNVRNNEHLRLPDPYIDAWQALRPHENGFTEDTSNNPMLWDSKQKRRHVRFDRVLIKSDEWTPTTIGLLGTEPISSACPRVFPSDHFGLLCRIVRAKPKHNN